MNITKARAFKALGQKIRQRYDMPFDRSFFLQEMQIEKFSESLSPIYKSFGAVYAGTVEKPGGHPDYNHLSNKENVGKHAVGNITAFFMDLKNFTKYCKFIPELEVYKAKAAVIEAVISICNLYGGHLHEIPGDGVLFFFGGESKDNLDACLQALQAACDAMAFIQDEIIPEYNNSDEYPNIHPKMGLDYGKVLWGAYGAAPFYETKATSFYVDIASKMMSECKAREIAIGDGIKNFANIDEEYIEKLWVYKKSHQKKSFEYQTWRFNWEKFSTVELSNDDDLSKLGLIGTIPVVSKSKSKLGDAPLA